MIYLVPARFVGSDGTPKARKISDDEDFVTCYFPVCSFRAVGFVDVPILVRGSS